MGLPAGTITPELARLADAGLLRREKRGNQQVYRANTSGPIFTELASILRKTSGLADVLSAALAPLAARVKLAFVFGLCVAACQPSTLTTAARDLLAATEARVGIIACTETRFERMMHCDLAVTAASLRTLSDALGLDAGTSGGTTEPRIAYLADGESLDDPAWHARVERAFHRQQWRPSRNGFAGAFLVYDPQRETARLWLSIAYG